MNFKKIFNFSTLLNVLGMTVAFASVYILAVQINYAFFYNHKIKDSERIYAVSFPSWYDDGKYQSFLCRPICETLIDNVACVESGGVAYTNSSANTGYFYKENESDLTALEITYSEASEGALAALSFEYVEGALDAFKGGNGVIISEKAAKKYSLELGSMLFSDTDKSNPMVVSAIYKDFPLNSDFSEIELVCNFGDKYLDNGSEWSFPYFVKLTSSDQKEKFESDAFNTLMKVYAEDFENVSEEEFAELSYRVKAHLVSIKDTYFDKTLESPGEQGNKTTTMTLLLIAVLLIVVAFINYINFFFAQVPTRIRGVNTRKILGSSRLSLVLSMVGESVFIIAISLVLSGVVVNLFENSSFARLISCDIAFSLNSTIMVLIIVLALFLAVVASIYPALYITSFNPAFVLKGSFAATSKGKTLRYILVGLQFVVTFSLITCTTFIRINHDYLMNKDMGINKEHLLCVGVTGRLAGNRSAAESKLLSDPRITDLAWGDGRLIRPSRMGWSRNFNGETISFQCYPVSWNFLRFMGIDVVEGRDFTEADELSAEGVFIFNESAHDKFGLTLESKVVGHKDETDIVGFCKDFNFKPMQYSISPFCFYIMGSDPWRYPSRLFIRTTADADVKDVISHLKASLAELEPYFVEHQANIYTFDEELGQQYSKELDLATLVGIFSLVSAVIVLMGLFGLVLFETRYRRKEIGIRRTQGAHIKDILMMFNKKFIYIVLICFVISVPISYFAIHRYFIGFANHVPIYWWVFLLVLLLVLAVTVVVVTLRSLRAATENPVESLKVDA